jgi:hypothetical protein
LNRFFFSFLFSFFLFYLPTAAESNSCGFVAGSTVEKDYHHITCTVHARFTSWFRLAQRSGDLDARLRFNSSSHIKSRQESEIRMGSIHVDDSQGQDQPKLEHVDMPSMGQTNGDGFRSFKVIDLASDQPSTPTGMKDEILLLSWLIVLLRTREDSQICYDWAYKGQENVVEGEPVNIRLSTDEVMIGLQSKAGQIATAISRHITTAAPMPCTAMSSPVSLLLSTGSLSQTSEGAKDEVSE